MEVAFMRQQMLREYQRRIGRRFWRMIYARWPVRTFWRVMYGIKREGWGG